MINLTEVQSEDNREFLVGDVVVSLCDGINPCLFEIQEAEHASYDEFLKCKPLDSQTGFVCFLAINEIRHASVAELNAKRRLTATEQALGEVS
ncbi:hypothetical protein [Acinetobacter sp. 243_ASPC]|uniref:hypothetical protein n=1 Tax=Acinetobacter sp. 243_ASPC TaxID=1579345 RepID=UPI00069EE369|nr:hypothetical protein [Acinetobacter sp. 243_ASPC]